MAGTFRKTVILKYLFKDYNVEWWISGGVIFINHCLRWATLKFERSWCNTNVHVSSLFSILSVLLAFVITKSNSKSDVHSVLLWDPFRPAVGPIQTSCGTHSDQLSDPFRPAVGPIQTICGTHLDLLLGPFRPAVGPIQTCCGTHSDQLWDSFRPAVGPI